VPVQVGLGSPAAQVSAGGSLASNGQSIALLKNVDLRQIWSTAGNVYGY
jgi:hypothetical protein